MQPHAPLTAYAILSSMKTCKVGGCGKKQRKASGYCSMHASRFYRYGTIDLPERRFKNPECLEDGCTLRAARYGYCRPHAKIRFPKGTGTGMSYGPVAKNGSRYYAVYAPAHPNKFPSNNYAPQHVLVMSEHLGRPLYSEENVHHINGVRDDNRIENLELWTTSQPSGQRVEDVVKWASFILERYSNELSHT